MDISEHQQLVNDRRRAQAREHAIEVLRGQLRETRTRLYNSRQASLRGDSLMGSAAKVAALTLDEQRLVEQISEAEAAHAAASRSSTRE